MFFDSLGKMPHEYPELRPDARCPECGGLLFKRGGGSKKCVEHWVHHSDKDRVCFAESLDASESYWHMNMKKAFRDEGYEVEKTIEINGKKYRADAIKGDLIVEFINSISHSYEQKTSDIVEAGYRLVWIFNGDVFSEPYIFGRELPGVAGRFSIRAQQLGAKVYLYVRGEVLGCHLNVAINYYGLTSVKRTALFLHRGFAGWMWVKNYQPKTFDDFIESDAYLRIPVCYSKEDVERLAIHD